MKMGMKYELRNEHGKRLGRGTRKELQAMLPGLPDGRYVIRGLRGPHYCANYLRQNGKLLGDTASVVMYRALPHILVTNTPDRPYPVVSMGVNASYAHIEEVTRYMYANTVEGKTPFLFSIHGFESDPRELWEVPEATRLCERLVASSFVSLLVVSTGDKDMARKAGVTLQDGWVRLKSGLWPRVCSTTIASTTRCRT